MLYFVIIPLYWFSGVACYLASERQCLSPNKRPMVSRKLALLISVVSIITSILLTWYATGELAESIVIQILFIMLFLPSPVFLLSHRPKWLKSSSFIVLGLALLIQFIG